ncbi:MAG: alkaline phosphatase family protein [Planctomycetes bacterium]|nr:alkaline phosphatase family protein [Planctomycetota bacterium]
MHREIAAVLCGLLLLALPATSPAQPRKDHCVILVSVDGLAGFYLDDPRAEMPTLRRLASEGARAGGLLCSFPTVTWPNHTTLVTGVEPKRHGVIGNNYLDRASGESVPLIPDPLFDKDQLVKVPTIYDAAHQAGLVTAGIVWPATRNARTLDYTVPDMFDDGWQKYGTQSWLAELRAEGLPVDKHGGWTRQSGGGELRDTLYTQMAAQVLQKHAPNLLLIHLVEVDHIEHRNGPRSLEAYRAVKFADDRLRELTEAIERSPSKGKTTLIVASDHGFFPIDKDIRPNVLLKQAGLIQMEGDRIAKKAAWCQPQGGACMVYVLDKGRTSEVAEQLAKQFAAVEGVDAVLRPSEFARVGQATADEDPRAPDLWLSAKSGYSFTETHNGADVVAPRSTHGGTHGYLPDQEEMLGTLVIWGAGVEPGAQILRARNIDVAPTIARLLGVELRGTDGKVLQSVLRLKQSD